MKNVWILLLLDLFRPIFIRSGIDYQQLRLVLQLQFTLDKRKAPPILKNTKIKEGKSHNLLLLSQFIYGFMGFLFAVISVFFAEQSILIGFGLYFFFFIVFISSSIVIEFSTDMFDVTDQQILFTKPLKPQLISLAKNIHILLYLSQIVFAFVLPMLVISGLVFGFLSSLLILVSSFSCLFFLFFSSAIMYGWLLRKFSGDRLKDIVNFIQVGSTIISMVGFQVIANANDFWSERIIDFAINNVWIILLPPFWFAAPIGMCINGVFSFALIIASLLGLFFSIGGYIFYLKKIAPRIERDLYRFNVEQISTKKPVKNNLLTGIISKNSEIGPFFDFSNIMFSRERKLKQALYPSIAMGLIYPFIMMFKAYWDSASNIADGKMFYTLYFLSVMCVPVGMYSMYSEYYKASWIYNFLPLKKPGIILKGAHLAIFLKYQLPLILIAFFVTLYIWKFKIVLDLLVIFLNLIIVQYANFLMSDRILPFSLELKAGQTAQFRSGSYLITMLVYIPLSGLIHFVFNLFDYGLTVLIILQILTVYLLYSKFYKFDWQEIEG